MQFKKVKISSFLIERTDRFKPSEANLLNFARLEKIDFNGNIYINNNKETKTNMILVKSGDLVISGINVEKGALAVYEGDEDVLATIHYSSYIYDKNTIDIEYLKWFLKSATFQNILKEQVKGGIKTEIKPKTFLNLEILLPDIKKQKEIAEKLNLLDSDVKDLDFTSFTNLELVKKLRLSILQEAVKGNLVPQLDTEESANVLIKKICANTENLMDEHPYELPKNWIWAKLGCLLEENKDITYGIVKMGLEPNEGVYALRCSDVKYRFIDSRNVRKVTQEVSDQYSRTILEGGEILMNIRGTLGGCAIVPHSLKGYNIAREIALIPISKEINNRYILDVLSSPYIQQTTFNNLRGIAYKGLNLNILRNFLIPLPPLNEQQRIVEKIDQLMKNCNELENLIYSSKIESEKLIDSILQNIFSNQG